MTTTLDIDEVTAFATAVRRELSDLGADIRDELTDGLEADLADKLDDGVPLGDPAAYAAELRAAAGLDARGTRGGLDAVAKKAFLDLRDDVRGFVAKHPWASGVASFLVVLRPAWWVLRGWVVFGLLNWRRQWSGVPDDAAQWVLLIAFVVLSVQWGRGRWLPWRWSRAAVIAVSVIAALMVLPVAYYSQLQLQERSYDYYPTPIGLQHDGNQVTNIFAYGPDGEPLTDVQLFDQNGDPLSLATQDEEYVEQYQPNGDYSYLVPNENVAGRKGWNVFPLQASSEAPGWDAGNGAYVSEVRPPLASVQPLIGYEAPEPEPDPAPDSQP
jgi:hypothetical protein